MKAKLPHILLGAVFLLFTGSTASVRAGTVVASDGHGGYGFAYGPHPKEELERTARGKLRKVSNYPDRVHVVFETSKKGVGVIIRYHVQTNDGDLQQIVADGGNDSEREAYEKAMKYVREHDGRRPEVVERWTDG